VPLSASDQQRVFAQWMRDNEDPLPFDKATIIATVSAIVDWWDANAAGAGGLNQALPAAFRTGATAAQKRNLTAYVLRRMSGSLRAEEDG
jgi:hypothetical protein